MLQLRQILVATVALTTACASGPQIRRLGDYPTSQPLFTTPQNQKTPSQMTVNLTRPAYVTALFVVPGRGAVIVYPTDSAMDTHLDVGAHTIPLRFSESPFNRDSMIAAMRREQGGRTNAPPRMPRDTMRRDTTTRIVRGDSGTRFGVLREPGPGASPIGYLVLVASSSPIPFDGLRHRVNGVTIPIDDDEALSTVMKLVKSTLPDGATLAAYAKELDRG